MKTNHVGGMDFPNRASQRGVGMVEVLVAMVLLAIGVLGYAALQIRAVEATGEALNRSQAMVILRGLAEQIRVNNAAQSAYPTAVQTYYSNLASAPLAPSKSCITGNCTSAELAIFDSYQTARTAFNLGMKISVLDCPGVNNVPKRQCLLAAWGKTTLPTGNSLPATASNPSTECMLSDGIYQPQATCLMMEAY